jgi:Tol biopolymer transport system component
MATRVETISRNYQESAMAEPSLGTSPPEGPLEGRLDSWKEIAAYLKRDVTTVQRWEKREGMPVHRHLHDRMGSVYASRAELDVWARSRHPALSQNGNGGTASDHPIAVPVSAEPSADRGSGVRLRWKLLAVGAIAASLAAGTGVWLQRTEYFWRSPIANARFGAITDFEGVAEAAAVSRDGHLVAFLSDRDGPMDVWITQVGSGEFHNLTHGSVQGLVNPSIRTPAFSPDGSLVAFWVRKPGSSGGESTSTWAVPTLGGQPRLYLDGVAEFDWTRDGSQLVYHTSAPGDPLYVSGDGRLSDARLLFTAPPGVHSHFPLWSPDGAFIYFVHGSVPDKLDVWRIRSTGAAPERITFGNGPVIYPALLDRGTLLYLATDADGSGPWLYSLDVERRIPHRLTSGPERYTSLAASADGRRLVLTLASPKRTLWRLSMADAITAEPARLSLSTGTAFSPRLGPNCLFYVSETGSGESIWRFADGAGTQLWSAPGARVIGGPAISPDARAIAFSVRQDGRSILYAMQADGTDAHIVADSLDLNGAPAWAPDGRSITTAVKDHGTPRLLRVPVDGGSPAVLVPDYALDPAWSPDGRFLLYSGPDVGTTFSVKAFPAGGAAPLPVPLTLTRGARHVAFLPGGRSIVFLEGNIQHKNLWQIDLQTGARRQLTSVPPGFDIADFDISPDGRQIVLERVQERSDVVLLDLPRP